MHKAIRRRASSDSDASRTRVHKKTRADEHARSVSPVVSRARTPAGGGASNVTGSLLSRRGGGMGAAAAAEQRQGRTGSAADTGLGEDVRMYIGDTRDSQ